MDDDDSVDFVMYALGATFSAILESKIHLCQINISAGAHDEATSPEMLVLGEEYPPFSEESLASLQLDISPTPREGLERGMGWQFLRIHEQISKHPTARIGIFSPR